MKRTCVISPKIDQKAVKASSGTANPKREALDVLTELEAALVLVEECSDEAFLRYIPDSLIDDLDLNIRALKDNINRQD